MASYAMTMFHFSQMCMRCSDEFLQQKVNLVDLWAKGTVDIKLVPLLLRVTGQNSSRQNGTDRMVLDKMEWKKWYEQNGTILYFVYTLIQLNSIYI